MFSTVEDFSRNWTEEATNTVKLIRAISDDSLEKDLIPNYKTMGDIVAHMINNLCNSAERIGVGKIEKPERSERVVVLADYYDRFSMDFVRLVQSNWTDSMLQEEIDIFHTKMKRGEVLTVLIRHQIHHRAQLTVMMRVAQLDVPGMYGASESDKRKAAQ